MRWPKLGWFLLTLVPLGVWSLPAAALEVKFCVPSCAADAEPFVAGPGAPSTVNGVTTNSLPIPQFVHKGFTISGTVTSQQSGTLQKITFNPTAITANAGTGCSAAAPCQLEIVATSSRDDFPTPKPTGGYPAGVFMAGYFTGVQPTHRAPPDPNGDTISMTGEAGGVSDLTGSPLNNAVINATPGTSSGDTAVSLPSSCTGSPACKFIATSAIRSFNTQIQETVQQVCDNNPATCLTRLRTTVNVSIKTAGNRVNLPGGSVSVTPPAPGEPPRDLAEILIAETLSPLGDVNVGQLLVWPNDFALTATLKLDPNRSIDPAREETYIRIGAFAMSIPAGEFRRLVNGRLFTFVGKLNGLDVAAALARDRRDPSRWLFTLGVHGVRLAVPAAPAQVQVDIAVGPDTGSDLVLAKVF